MDGIDGGFWRYGDDSRPTRDTTFFGGTYIQHPLSMAAARAVLTHLKEQGPGAPADAERPHRRVRRPTLNGFFAAEEFPLDMAHFGSMFRFTHRADMELLYHHLILRGFYVWEWRNFFLSTAHTDDRRRTDHRRGEGLTAGAARGRFFTPRSLARGRSPTPSWPASPAPGVPRGPRPRALAAPDFGRLLSSATTPLRRGPQPAGRSNGCWRPPGSPTPRVSTRMESRAALPLLRRPLPQPVVLAAALARETRRIRMNAGSVVLPLHDPMRIAEEWSMADNLSRGRVGIGCRERLARGRLRLLPGPLHRRSETPYEQLEEVRRLWRGEASRAAAAKGSSRYA